MWNVKDDTTGWNLDKEREPKTECNFCKENRICGMSNLLHCDYRKGGFCTLYQHQEQPNESYFEELNDYLDGSMNV